MTLTKRVIPCLDVANGRVVKGLHFKSIKDAGDPVLLAEKYSNEGADELVFLDITASEENREIIKSLVSKVAQVINIHLLLVVELRHFSMQGIYCLVALIRLRLILAL